MVEFLVARGVEISLLTFHGYQCGDRMILARQVEGSVEGGDIRRSDTASERRRTLAERARDLNIASLWQDAVKALGIASSGYATRSGITFYLPKITLPDDVNVYGSHSVVIDKWQATRHVLSSSSRCLLGAVSGQERDNPIQVRGTT